MRIRLAVGGTSELEDQKKFLSLRFLFISWLQETYLLPSGPQIRCWPILLASMINQLDPIAGHSKPSRALDPEEPFFDQVVEDIQSGVTHPY